MGISISEIVDYIKLSNHRYPGCRLSLSTYPERMEYSLGLVHWSGLRVNHRLTELHLEDMKYIQVLIGDMYYDLGQKLLTEREPKKNYEVFYDEAPFLPQEVSFKSPPILKDDEVENLGVF